MIKNKMVKELYNFMLSLGFMANTSFQRVNFESYWSNEINMPWPMGGAKPIHMLKKWRLNI